MKITKEELETFRKHKFEHDGTPRLFEEIEKLTNLTQKKIQTIVTHENELRIKFGNDTHDT